MLGCSLRQGVHAQTHCWMCFSTMLPWGGAGGRNNCFFEWCFLPLSICTGFYSVFRAFPLLFFCTICVFPWFLQCFQASWRWWCYATLGWGVLTFHVTCSCCWCYATLGCGGMLTFHVTCSRCWCYATLGWGWGRGSRLPLLSRGAFLFFWTCCGTGRQSMGVSVAQRVLESECNVETSDSAKMTNQAGRAWIGRPTVVMMIITPSGKHTKNYRKSPFLMGQFTISMAMFNSKLLVYQRVLWSLSHENVYLNFTTSVYKNHQWPLREVYPISRRTTTHSFHSS